MAKKKAKKVSRKRTLKKVPAKDYAVAWNKSHTKCEFQHKNGKGGSSVMGVSDVAMVFISGRSVCLLTVNYAEGYACMECFIDGEGASALCFADPNDCTKLFGPDLSAVPPKKIAERLLKEC